MRTGARAAGDIDPLHRGDELRESERRIMEIRDALDDRVLAGKPSANRPAPGVTLSRRPHRKRDRDGKRQMRRESRQPQVLLVGLRGGPFDARQSHGHVVAEAIDRVVGTAGPDPLDGEIGPLRKLRGEQPAHQ